MNIYEFTVSIAPDAWLEFYRRPNSTIIATDVHGRTIQLAAKHFQQFVSSEGIRGKFQLTLSEHNDFIQLKKVR